MRRLTYLLVLVFSVLVVAAACNPAPTTTDTIPPTDDLGDAGLGATGPEMVTVGLIESRIDMPATIQAGMVTFEVTNGGTMEHNFVIEGSGVQEMFDTDLQPGETRALEVQLAPGTYTVYCPIADHAEQGMQLQLEVT